MCDILCATGKNSQTFAAYVQFVPVCAPPLPADALPVCAVALRHYTRRPELYQQLLDSAKRAPPPVHGPAHLPPWHAHALPRPDAGADPWERPAVPLPASPAAARRRATLVHALPAARRWIPTHVCVRTAFERELNAF